MEYYQQQAARLQELVEKTTQLETTVAPVAADGTPAPDIDTRLVNLRTAITGQRTLIGSNMQNRTSALRLNVLEPRVTNIEPFTYPFEQQSEVAISHNRGRYVRATCYDVNGTQVEGALTQPDLNTIQLIFSQPFSGTVVLS
jgi:hypothetical protein